MITVTTFIEDNGVERHVHKLEEFPSYGDMVLICMEDNIRADDFRHYRVHDTFFVGDFIRAGGKSGKIKSGRRGLKFLVRTDKPVTYGDLVR